MQYNPSLSLPQYLWDCMYSARDRFIIKKFNLVSGKVAGVTPYAAERSDIKLGDHVIALVSGGGYAGMPLHAAMKIKTS